LRARLEQATAEIALLREELSIKDGRWERSPPRRRPHYLPTHRAARIAENGGFASRKSFTIGTMMGMRCINVT